MEPDRVLATEEIPLVVQRHEAPPAEAYPDTTQEPMMGMVPMCLCISKQLLLRQALQLLALEIHELRVCTVGNGHLLGSVCFDVPAHGGSPIIFQKKFFGAYSLIEEEALESASLAALTYLQEEGIISVDDANIGRLKLCETKLLDSQRKLLAASNWATIFQERAESLQSDLAATSQLEKKPVTTAKKANIKNEMSYTPPSGHLPDASQLKCKKPRVLSKPKCRKSLFKEGCAAASTSSDADTADKCN